MAKSIRLLLIVVLSVVLCVMAPSPGTASSGKFSNEAAWDDGQNFHFRVNSANYAHMCVLIDNDMNDATGYSWNGIGADYMLEDNKLYRYGMSSGSAWTWGAPLTSVTCSSSAGVYECSVPLTLIGSPTTARVGFEGFDSFGNPIPDPNLVTFTQGVSSGSGEGSSGGGVTSSVRNDFSGETATDDGFNLYFRAACAFPYPHFQVFIDTQMTGAHGYSLNGIGASYILEDNRLYNYAKSAEGEPVWQAGDAVVIRSNPAPDTYEFAVPLASIGSPSTAKIIFQAVDAGGFTITDPNLITYVRGSGGTGPSMTNNEGQPLIDDAQAGWIWSGMVENDDDQCKGGSQHVGGSETYAAYTFNGTGVAVYAMTGPTIEVGDVTHKLGRMSITIDDKPAGEYSLYQAFATYQSKIFAVTGLPAGNHVIQMTADAGWIDVDYLQVFTDGPSAGSAIAR